MEPTFSLTEIDQLIRDLQPDDPYRWWSLPAWARQFEWQPPLLRFQVWLAGTVAWCMNANINQSLQSRYRSPRIAPYVFIRNRFEAVNNVHQDRFFARHHIDGFSISIPTSLISQGRLLVYYPEKSLGDGAAAVETEGYFDSRNTPPWDTWIDYFEEPSVEGQNGWERSERYYLIAWVPPALVEVIQRGIDVNPEQCLQWLEDSNTLFKDLWTEAKHYKLLKS